jgi:hypothetical protein
MVHTTIHIQKRDGICLQNLPPQWILGEMRKSHNSGILHLKQGSWGFIPSMHSHCYRCHHRRALPISLWSPHEFFITSNTSSRAVLTKANADVTLLSPQFRRYWHRCDAIIALLLRQMSPLQYAMITQHCLPTPMCRHNLWMPALRSHSNPMSDHMIVVFWLFLQKLLGGSW